MDTKQWETICRCAAGEDVGRVPGALKIFHNDTNNPVSYGHVGELGVQIFNFTHLQPIAEVRRRVGAGVCLMGNVPPLEVLVQGSPEQVRESGRRCMREHGGRAGLLLSAGGGVSPGTPGDSVEALMAVVMEESDDA
ncbi:MAG: uroporphyrinogen decarboxylase [Verrucomicrobiota bacterium]|jgi:uroporphyrinogen decarboxylase